MTKSGHRPKSRLASLRVKTGLRPGLRPKSRLASLRVTHQGLVWSLLAKKSLLGENHTAKSPAWALLVCRH